MPEPSKEVRWTPQMFQTLVEKYVFRTKINEKFKSAIAEMGEDRLLNVDSGLNLLKLLFDENNEIKESYGSPKELMADLYHLQKFPNNSEFLGLKDSLNYQSMVILLGTTDGQRVSSVTDAFVAFERGVVEEVCKFTALMAKSMGNWIGRYKKGSFDLIPYDIFENRVKYESFLRSRFQFDVNLKLESINDVFSILSNYYDKEHDDEILIELKKMLDHENNRRPLAENRDFYQKICSNHACFRASIKAAFVTSNIEDSEFLNSKIPTARFFDDQEGMNPNKKIFFAKELENALDLAMKQRHGKEFPKGLFPVETPEERELGILRVVEWETFEKILKILKLPINSLHLVDYDIDKTSRQIQVPINTPYGTYCVLAKNAFIDVLAQVTSGMQLFRAVNKENVAKIFEWFENLDVFSESRKYRYFIETWKVDEIINCAYEQLQQFSTEPVYKLTKTIYTKSDVVKELCNFSPHFPGQNELKSCYELCFRHYPNKRFTFRDAHSLYESAIFLAFVDYSPKYTRFLSNQGVGPNSQNKNWEMHCLQEMFKGNVQL